MRISDWSSDVCSSDLMMHDVAVFHQHFGQEYVGKPRVLPADLFQFRSKFHAEECKEYDEEQPKLEAAIADRQSVVSGKRVSVRVDLGGRRIMKKNKVKKCTCKCKLTLLTHNIK